MEAIIEQTIGTRMTLPSFTRADGKEVCIGLILTVSATKIYNTISIDGVDIKTITISLDEVEIRISGSATAGDLLNFIIEHYNDSPEKFKNMIHDHMQAFAENEWPQWPDEWPQWPDDEGGGDWVSDVDACDKYRDRVLELDFEDIPR